MKYDQVKNDYITVAAAAQRKGFSRTRIYNAIAAGELSTYQVLGKTALRCKEVDAWQPSGKAGRRSGSSMSSEARQKISEGQKKRWAQRKKISG